MSAEKKTFWRRYRLLICAAAVVLVWVLFAKFIAQPGDDDVAQWGQYGDSFGFLNSLFSALAFAVLIATMLDQRDALKEQGDEIKASLDAQKASADALKLQAEMSLAETRINAMRAAYKYYDEQMEECQSAYGHYKDREDEGSKKLADENIAGYFEAIRKRHELKTRLDEFILKLSEGLPIVNPPEK